MEDRLILDFHLFRRRQIAQQIIAAMKEVAAGGLFEEKAVCEDLWDEACWALQEPDDYAAQQAAADTIAQFATAYTADVSSEELRLHAYLLTDNIDETGRPSPDVDAFVKDVTEVVQAVASDRDVSGLEVRCRSGFDDSSDD